MAIRFSLALLLLVLGCGDDDTTDPRPDAAPLDSGARDFGQPDLGVSTVPESFARGVEALSLAVRATGPMKPLAERLRDESLTITEFEATRTTFNDAILMEADTLLHATACTTMEELGAGQVGVSIDRGDCLLAFDDAPIRTVLGAGFLEVEPRNEGWWAFRESWEVGDLTWSAAVDLRVGGDCAEGSTSCVCEPPRRCGVNLQEWRMEMQAQGDSVSYGGGGLLVVREADGSLELGSPFFSPEPRTYSVETIGGAGGSLVWQAGDCLPSSGTLRVVTLDEPSGNAEVEFLEDTPTTGEVIVSEIELEPRTVQLFESCE